MRDDKDTRSDLLPLNLRVERRTLQLIDRAVAEVGGEQSRFIVDAACRRAEDILLDRCLFHADDQAFETMERALESSDEGGEAPRALVRRGRYWSL